MTQGALRHTLVVRHPETGEATALLAGEPVPAWASALVHADDVVAKAASKKTPAKSDS